MIFIVTGQRRDPRYDLLITTVTGKLDAAGPKGERKRPVGRSLERLRIVKYFSTDPISTLLPMLLALANAN